MHLRCVQQVVGLQMLRRGVQHWLGRINCGEAPVRLQRGHCDDFLRRTASADDQYFGRPRVTETGGQHARRKIVTGIVTGQCDAALPGVFAGAGGIEFIGGIGSG